ncbi:MAG: nucleoside diphosphate kinase regulator [Hyphomicrobiales bacterium]|nr:nucleoside diphosphate kinase regulator [Hyphomicrobiales bacterium]
MTGSSRLPPITLLASDRERLARLAQAGMSRFPETAEYLAREVERARIVEPDQDGEAFVKMGSWVQFRDNDTGGVRCMTLVYPDRADVTLGRISVLTPVGAALIGLSEGQSIEWQTPAGERRSLTVLAVRAPQNAFADSVVDT